VGGEKQFGHSCLVDALMSAPVPETKQEMPELWSSSHSDWMLLEDYGFF